MKVIAGASHLTDRLVRPVVTIGNFDGVHVGHRKIFETVLARARAINGTSVVYTFEPHPRKVLASKRPPPLLMTPEQRRRLIEELGVDVLIIERFTKKFAAQGAEEFVDGTLIRWIRPVEVLVGHDFHFGKGRGASHETLRAAGAKHDFRVQVIDEVLVDDLVVSSTRIRTCLGRGEVELAARLLGRPYSVEGWVVRGAGRGRDLGFPTANVDPANELMPARGVYAARVSRGGKAYPGVANIGIRPTFDESTLTLEVHILEGHEGKAAMYGRVIEVMFIARIRDETRFASPDALVSQIRRDIVRARELLR